jgi:hypothetical protein
LTGSIDLGHAPIALKMEPGRDFSVVPPQPSSGNPALIRRHSLLLFGLALGAAGIFLPQVMTGVVIDRTTMEFAQGGLVGMGLLLVLRWVRQVRGD